MYGTLVFKRVVLIVGLLASVLSITAMAQADLPENTPVIVVEDKTVEADCKVQLDQSALEQACPSGSVIFAREVTYGEAKKSKIKDYIISSRDAKKGRGNPKSTCR